MAACEPCWNEAYRQSRLLGGSQVDHYRNLLEVLDGHPHDGEARPIPPAEDDYPDMPCEDCEQGLSSCCIPPADGDDQ